MLESSRVEFQISTDNDHTCERQCSSNDCGAEAKISKNFETESTVLLKVAKANLSKLRRKNSRKSVSCKNNIAASN